MKLLDRYILGRFLRYFLFAMMASALIFITVDTTEMLDKFIDAKLPWSQVFYYYYLYVPYIVYLTLPVSVLLATLFSIGGFVYRNELTAMQSAGYSLWRIFGMFLVIAVPLSLITLVFGESVVPAANHIRKEMYRTEIKKSGSSTATRQGRLYIQVGPGEYLRMENYDASRRAGDRASLHLFQDGRLDRRVDAQGFEWNGSGWTFRGVEVRDFRQQPLRLVTLDSLARQDLALTPDDLQRVNIEPEEMNYRDLQTMVNRLQASGIRAGKWLVDLAFKISQPFATVIIVLFGVPFAAFRRRGGLVFGFGLSLLVCFVYFGFMQVGKILGYQGMLEPVIAAWAGNIVFGVIGLVLAARVPK